MPSTYITKAQRKILIESYLDCQEEMGEGNATFDSLNALNNSKLIQECVAFMPDCMDEI